MKLPPEFISIVTSTFGEEGEDFIAHLPELVDEASVRWGLTSIEPVPNLSYNFVAYATSPSPTSTGSVRRPAPLSKGEGSVVLKIGVPRDELTSEMEALRLFNGEGACRLIECDEDKGFLLLERLHPGVMLATLEDDDEATRIAADLMQRLWRSDLDTITVSKFIQLIDWFDGLRRMREMSGGRTGPLNERLVERVEGSVKNFFAENHMPALMHGDFHHFNILSSERGWVVIDPKGVIGPAGYEVGPLMMNPWGDFSDGIKSRRRVKRRIEILREHLGFERERIVEWSLAHAILSAWWGIEDKTGWEYSMQFAELMAGL